MKPLRIGWIVLVVALLLGLQSPAHGQEGPNLLRNGDFEEGGRARPGLSRTAFRKCRSHRDGGHSIWMIRPLMASPARLLPGRCAVCLGTAGIPGVASSEFAYRVHSGQLAQKYFSWNRQHEAGLYQQVGGIQPGTRLRFSVWIQTWSCMPAPGTWNQCRTAPLSDSPAPMHVWVGIDPTGGTDWSAPPSSALRRGTPGIPGRCSRWRRWPRRAPLPSLSIPGRTGRTVSRASTTTPTLTTPVW